MVAIPRREIEPRLAVPRRGRRRRTRARRRPARRATGSSPPSARRRRRPEAEAVVVLGREDHRAEAGGARGARPLSRVELRRIEDRGILVPSPHSRSVNVFTPKWRNIASSSRCHCSCAAEGTARARRCIVLAPAAATTPIPRRATLLQYERNCVCSSDAPVLHQFHEECATDRDSRCRRRSPPRRVNPSAASRGRASAPRPAPRQRLRRPACSAPSPTASHRRFRDRAASRCRRRSAAPRRS